MTVKELRLTIAPQIHLHIFNQKTDDDFGWADRISESKADSLEVTYITLDGYRRGNMTLLVYVKQPENCQPVLMR